MTAASLAVAIGLLLSFFPAPGPGEDTHNFAECKAIAPATQSCTLSIVPHGGVALEIPHDVVFSGTLDLFAEQFGVVVWNGTCIVPLGFADTGVGLCKGEPDERFVVGQTLNVTVQIGIYGYGWYGLRAYY